MPDAQGVSVGRYAFTVRDSHPLLLAGLPAHIGFVLQFAIEALGVAKLSVSLALTLLLVPLS